MRTALFAVASVWILGCVWSFQEQSNFAASKGFVFPHLLPLVIDGFAVSMAGVAWAASLDARPAVPARLATVVAVAASSTSNGVWAWLRANHDMVTVVLGVAVPVAANLAFEVLLAELRRQVQRRRGLPPPVAVPYPRLIRFVLAPWATFFAWRTMVLEITAMEHTIAPSAAALRGRSAGDRTEIAEATQTTEIAAPAPVAVSRSTTAWVSGVDSAEPPAPELAAPEPTAPEPTAPEPTPPATDTEPAPAAGPVPASAMPGAAHGAGPTFPPTQPAARPQPTQPAAHPESTQPIARPAHAESPMRSATSERPSRPAPERAVEDPAASLAHAVAPERTGPASGSGTGSTVPSRPRPSNAQAAVPTTNGAPPHNALVASHDRSDGHERPVDPRVEQLARQLAVMDDADEVTGERVSELLQIDVAPRTGRRLLGQARDLLTRRARAQDAAQGLDSELSVIGGR
ncbi:MAG: DUF2637 domain-containing protein [Pseudonocardia sp.]|nr:DUF2637 domain-containing protein [Pseudonocardia sp.]